MYMAVGTVGPAGVHIGVGLLGASSRILFEPPSSWMPDIGSIVDPLAVFKYIRRRAVRHRHLPRAGHTAGLAQPVARWE